MSTSRTPPTQLDPLLGETRVALLSLFFLHPDERFHLREVIRRTAKGQGAVQREILLLFQLGLLTKEPLANLILYQANPQSPLYPDLLSLIVKTVGVGDLLRRALEPIASHIRCAFIFGSFARGRHSKSSDVDLMVIGHLTYQQLSDTLLDAQHQLNREINPSLFSPRDFVRKIQAENHFLSSVLKAPKILLIGTEHELAQLAAGQPITPAPNQP